MLSPIDYASNMYFYKNSVYPCMKSLKIYKIISTKVLKIARAVLIIFMLINIFGAALWNTSNTYCINFIVLKQEKYHS